jgi:hypothetical protein
VNPVNDIIDNAVGYRIYLNSKHTAGVIWSGAFFHHHNVDGYYDIFHTSVFSVRNKLKDELS